MKKLLVAGTVLSAVVSGSAFADRLYVEYRGTTKEYEFSDFKQVSVCMLKSRVASNFSLDEGKFDLVREGNLLDENGTLASASIYHTERLQIKPVDFSFQCN